MKRKKNATDPRQLTLPFPYPESWDIFTTVQTTIETLRKPSVWQDLDQHHPFKRRKQK